MAKIGLPLVVGLICSVTGGCGTLITCTNIDKEGTRYGLVYSGVRFDYRAASDPNYMQHIPPGKLLCVLDFPLSLATDTIALPATLPIKAHRSRRLDGRLLGTWESDEGVAASQLGYTAWGSVKFDGTSRPVIDFSRKLMVITIAGLSKSYPYRITHMGTNSVTIFGPPGSPPLGFLKITYDSSGLWYNGGYRGGNLHYRRREPSQ